MGNGLVIETKAINPIGIQLIFNNCFEGRLTAYEFSDNTGANAPVLSAATRG